MRRWRPPPQALRVRGTCLVYTSSCRSRSLPKYAERRCNGSLRFGSIISIGQFESTSIQVTSLTIPHHWQTFECVFERIWSWLDFRDSVSEISYPRVCERRRTDYLLACDGEGLAGRSRRARRRRIASWDGIQGRRRKMCDSPTPAVTEARAALPRWHTAGRYRSRYWGQFSRPLYECRVARFSG
jgi:hypothetical protein